MLCEKIKLWDEHPECYLQTFVCEEFLEQDRSGRAAMIICPGGGYRFLSPRESEPIARQFLAAGMNVFVLYYSVAPMAKDRLKR